MKKTLILRMSGNDYMTRTIRNCEIEKYYRCDYYNFFLRIARGFRITFLGSIFLEKWKRNISSYDTIILFDNGYAKIITNFIRKHNKKCKIILWYWNPIIEYNKQYLKDENINEFWSYDKNDCDRYNLKHNTQFYNKEIKLENNNIESDVLFLGANKGRKEFLDNCKKTFDDNNIDANIIVVENKKDYVSYEEYLRMISKTKVLLDIVNPNVVGLTLRCLESLFFEKKLITNNKDIMNYDFYNKNNIFILGIDDKKSIKEFIEKPYIKIDKDLLYKYDFEKWVERFSNEEKKNERE